MPGKAAIPAAGFYAGLQPVRRFRDLAAIERYRPVPDGATLFLADVVNSTDAIDKGRYKQVNVAAASVIAAVSNALPGDAAAFSFGGDGASFVLEREHEGVGRETLAAAVGWVRRELDLELRAAAVPVGAIRAKGHDLMLARFAVSPTLSYAMFAGGGLAWAEARMKAGEYRVEAPPVPVAVDLTGLHCRFAELPARNGVILSLIVVPASPAEAHGFPAVATELLALATRREADVRPVRDGAPRLEWTLAKFLLETKTTAARTGGRGVAALARSGLASALANFTLRTGLPVGGFDPKRYLTEVVRNTDFRKFDDGLRMTLDCALETADEIENFLATEHTSGRISYGTHRQDAAMLTCFVPSPTASDHVHFVDGAAGGYAFAARALKQQQQREADPAADESQRGIGHLSRPLVVEERNEREGRNMSDIPTKPASEGGGGAPDPDAQELAAKHNIPLEEAERVIRERGNDRGEVDAEAQKRKTDGTIDRPSD